MVREIWPQRWKCFDGDGWRCQYPEEIPVLRADVLVVAAEVQGQVVAVVTLRESPGVEGPPYHSRSKFHRAHGRKAA